MTRLEKTSTDKRKRSCVVCGLKTDKTKLFRLVRDGQAHVSFDKTGKKPGRGAYVCSATCLGEVDALKRIGRALKSSLSQDDYQRIIEEFRRQCVTGKGSKE